MLLTLRGSILASMAHYKLSIVGGTFDHLHIGHTTLLNEAFKNSERVIIGLSIEKLYQNKPFAKTIESYIVREETLHRFLAENNLLNQVNIVPLIDFYGNSLTEKSVDAIFITEDNEINVKKMNDERIKRGFAPMAIERVPFQKGNDDEIVSSGRIRSGQIDRNGNAYKKLLLQKEQVLLPKTLREKLRKPIGTVFTDMEDVFTSQNPQNMLITIGDVVTLSCINHNHQADISVVDLKTRRDGISKEEKKLLHDIHHRLETQNMQGTVEKQAIKTLQNAFANYFSTHKKQLIIVDGEEDLLVIPTILLAPLESLILYGQYNIGIVGVTVTEEKKQEIVDLLAKFV